MTPIESRSFYVKCHHEMIENGYTGDTHKITCTAYNILGEPVKSCCRVDFDSFTKDDIYQNTNIPVDEHDEFEWEGVKIKSITNTKSKDGPIFCNQETEFKACDTICTHLRPMKCVITDSEPIVDCDIMSHKIEWTDSFKITTTETENIQKAVSLSLSGSLSSKVGADVTNKVVTLSASSGRDVKASVEASVMSEESKSKIIERFNEVRSKCPDSFYMCKKLVTKTIKNCISFDDIVSDFSADYSDSRSIPVCADNKEKAKEITLKF